MPINRVRTVTETGTAASLSTSKTFGPYGTDGISILRLEFALAGALAAGGAVSVTPYGIGANGVGTESNSRVLIAASEPLLGNSVWGNTPLWAGSISDPASRVIYIYQPLTFAGGGSALAPLPPTVFFFLLTAAAYTAGTYTMTLDFYNVSV
jgi:hypothetical protein